MFSKSDLLGAFALETHQVNLRRILPTTSEYYFDLVDGLEATKEKIAAYRRANPLLASGRKKQRRS